MEMKTPKNNKHTHMHAKILNQNTSNVKSEYDKMIEKQEHNLSEMHEHLNKIRSSLDSIAEGNERQRENLESIERGLLDYKSAKKKVAEYNEWQQKKKRDAREKEVLKKLERARKGPSKEDVVNMYIILTDEKKLGKLNRSPEEFYDLYKDVFVVYSKEETLKKREEMMRLLDDEDFCKEYVDEFINRDLESRFNMTTNVLRVVAGTEDLVANAEWAINNTKEWYAPEEQTKVKLLVEKDLNSLKEGLDEQFLRIEPNWMSYLTAKNDLLISVSDNAYGGSNYSNFQIIIEGHLVRIELATKDYVISAPVMNIFTFYWGVSAREIWEEARKNGVRDERENPIESDRVVQQAVTNVFSMMHEQDQAVRACRHGTRLFDGSSDTSAVVRVDENIKRKAFQWCQKYEVLFRVISVDEDLKKCLRDYSAYSPANEHMGLFSILHECMKEADDNGLIISNYRKILDETRVEELYTPSPTEEWVDKLSEEQILAYIAWHFRKDYFSTAGSWIYDSVANGYMLVLVQGYLKRRKERS